MQLKTEAANSERRKHQENKKTPRQVILAAPLMLLLAM